jgi:hypothetical protein
VIVLGADGMDPAYLEAHWGELPNLARLKNEGELRRLGIGGWREFAGDDARAGKNLFEALAERGIPAVLLRTPQEERRGQARVLALRPADDAQPHLYSDDAGISGPRVIAAKVDDHRAVIQITGAKTPITMTVDIDTETPTARFMTGDDAFVLKQGEWSGWVRAQGRMFRVYAKQLAPRFQVYVTGLNIDPSEPAEQISWPASYGKHLAEIAGLFYTQDQPHDVRALRDGILDRGEFAEQSRAVSREEMVLLDRSVSEFGGGFYLFEFDGIEQDAVLGRDAAELLADYQMVDGAVERIRKTHPRAALLVVSKHGVGHEGALLSTSKGGQREMAAADLPKMILDLFGEQAGK